MIHDSKQIGEQGVHIRLRPKKPLLLAREEAEHDAVLKLHIKLVNELSELENSSRP